MKKLLLTVLMCFVPFFAFAQVNLGFETGDFTGWGTTPAASGSSFGVSSAFSHSGNHSAQFGATGTEMDEIRQLFGSVQGAPYQIKMWVYSTSSTNQNLQVIWTNNLFNGPVVPANQWTELTFNTTGSGGNSTTLYIRARNANGFTYVDDISVTAVPEPTTLAVIGLGAVSLLRRRKAS